MWPLFREKISQHTLLADEEYELVTSFFKYKTYKKRQFILQEGNISKYETFILKGCVRVYDVNDTGQEHVLQFGIEGWWVNSLHSFINETPSDYDIECLENSEVLHITKPDLEKLYKQVPAMERYFRILFQEVYMSSQHRVCTLLAKSAGKRYRDFLKLYPQVGERIPDRQVALYLGVTPQSLSRIRSQFAGK